MAEQFPRPAAWPLEPAKKESRAVSPFPPSKVPEPRTARVVLENTGRVVWYGSAQDAEAIAIDLNGRGETNLSYRPEVLEDDGTWQPMGFRRGRS
jgi:hypothetical protein